MNIHHNHVRIKFKGIKNQLTKKKKKALQITWSSRASAAAVFNLFAIGLKLELSTWSSPTKFWSEPSATVQKYGKKMRNK